MRGVGEARALQGFWAGSMRAPLRVPLLFVKSQGIPDQTLQVLHCPCSQHCLDTLIPSPCGWWWDPGGSIGIHLPLTPAPWWLYDKVTAASTVVIS